jgi:predicted nucleic-acid-binding protein
MKAIDTSVVVRFLAHDDPKASPQAERLIRAGAFVPDTVLVEVEWVLRHALGIDRAEVEEAFDHLVRLPSLEFADRAAVEEAVILFRKGLDFADAMHAASSFRYAKTLRTFDKAFVKGAKAARARTKVEGGLTVG